MTDPLVNLDDVVVGGLEPATWYLIVHGQIDLLRNHVNRLEKEIDESIKAYQTEKSATHVEYDNDGYPFPILEEHLDIEAPPRDLEEIFESYFPNLRRRSTLITVFSFLEHQLNQLCQLFAKTERLSVLYSDLKGKGIDRSRLYLKKVILLPVDDNSPVWQDLKKIQKVRNAIVHSDAKLWDPDIIKIVKDVAYLSLASDNESNYGQIDDTGIADEVNILEGYLNFVLDTCDSYCRELNKAIESRP